MYYENDKIKDD